MFLMYLESNTTLIEDIKSNNTTKTRVNKKLTREIKINTGNIREAVNERNFRFKLDNDHVHGLYYAVNAVLILESEDDLQGRILHSNKDTTEKYSL